MLNIQGSQVLGHVEMWKVRLETKRNGTDTRSDARFAGSHDA